MFWPGTIALWTALFAGLASFGCYLAADRGGRGWMTAARRTYLVFTAAVLSTCGIMLTLILQHRFDVAYVASYSSRDLPLKYLVSSFWGGQEGSFLLWIFWGAIIGLVVSRSAKEMEAPVMAICIATFVSLVVIVCRQSPFRLLARIPEDGSSLNPLLQDNWMVIHPPVMFSGFASLSVPFSFAVAALWKKRWDGWITRALPWALFSFVTLGTAILMGGYWAYKTLGWGGYWGWDPVENTSLVPWLATVALVHGMFLQKMRAKHRKINIILAILAFCCILYGTFLTRSGVLADFSVHSFIDLGITGWLVGIILVFLVGGLGLLAWRWREIPVVSDVDAATGKEKEEPFLSRSVLFILSVTLFCASGLVILLGTSAPILTRVAGKPSQVATSFYNVTHRPIVGLMALLLLLVPYLSWRGESGKGVLRKALIPLVVGLLGVGVFFAAGVRGAGDLLILALAVAGFVANAGTAILFVRRKAVKTMGGYLAHIGMSIMLVGILISGVYEKRTTVNLLRNQPVSVGKNTLTFTRTVFVTDSGDVKRFEELNAMDLSDRRAKQAMEVEVSSPGRSVWKAYPKLYTNTRTNQMMANPDVKSSPLMDLYVSPQAYDPGRSARIEGTTFALKKGESKTVEGVKLKFLDFSADRSQVSSDRPHVTVTGNFLVTTAEVSEEKTARLVMYFGEAATESATESPETPLPGKGRLKLLRVSPNEGTCEIELLGIAPGGDLKPATGETLSVDLTTKPLISLVWGGFYVMMAGGLVALVRRARDSRQAAIA